MEAAKWNLHYTLAGIKNVVETRAHSGNPAVFKKVAHAREKHCGQCHSSCGQCHVSRPNYVEGGFLSGHSFLKQPPMDVTCASCHGGRVCSEFIGVTKEFASDVHCRKKKMACSGCHKSAEIHASAKAAKTRLDLPMRPQCVKCHKEVVSDNPKTTAHAIHKGKVGCQVCHCLPYKNCFNCHVGTDSKGLPYYKCAKTTLGFKIGFNPAKSARRPAKYVLLRHPPVNPGLFDAYVPNGLPGISKLPTWKISAPHNVQRITPQNKKCNNCHGNAGIF